MKRLPHVAVLLVAVALVAADEDEKKKGDAEKIQGKWRCVESFRKGEKREREVGGVMTFSGKNFTIFDASRDRKMKGTFELRPDKKPQELDLVFNRFDEETTGKLIYKLSGDTLKICGSPPGKPRPKAVGSTADDERDLLVLKRVKGDDKE